MISKYLSLYLGLLLLGGLSSLCSAKTEMGVNVNGRLEFANEARMAEVETRWIRGFVPVLQLIETDTDLEDRPEFVEFRRIAALPQYQAILSLRWDFRHTETPLPENASPEMRRLIDKVAELLAFFGPDIDILVVGNEPMWETMEADRERQGGNGPVPSVRFYKRIANVANDWRARNGARFDIFLGAFNRLDLERNRNAADVRGMIQYARKTDWVSGIDIHPHNSDIGSLEAVVAAARSLLGSEKDIIATEHSLVWRWKQNLNTPVDDGFLRERGLDRDWTTIDYLNHARDKPVVAEEWNAFLESADWYPKDYHSQVYKIFRKYNVRVSTYGFQIAKRRGRIRADQNPWYLNPLFLSDFVEPDKDGLPPNGPMFDDFVEMSQRIYGEQKGVAD